jgi:tetratricopeptide (TPR) repeat protein
MRRYLVSGWIGRLIGASTLLVALPAVSVETQAGADPPAVPSCPSGARFPDVEALATASADDEHALDPRLKLAEALLAHGCYAEAVGVLEQGDSLHRGNGGIQSRLRNARTLLSEQHYFHGLDRAAETAKTERNLLRCRKLGDIAACDDALRDKPDDAGIVISKADAVMQLDRPADALPLYRQAARLDPTSDVIDEKIAAAESRRQALLSQCQQESADTALRACEAALLRGAGDEFSIYQRKGIVLQSMDQPSQALDSYIAASRLKSDDDAVSLAIVALTDSTGRKDALALAARGHALLTLNRATEAVQAFLAARALVPDLPDVDAPLAAARERAQSEARRAAIEPAKRPAAPAPAAPAADVVATEVVDAPAVNQADIRPATEERRMYSNNSPVTRSN